MTSTRLASSGFSETRVWVECLVSRALKTWSRSLLFKDIRIFAYSSTREQSNKTSGTRLKTESETAKGLKWCPRTFRVTLFSLFGEHQGIIYPPPRPTYYKTCDRGNRQQKILFSWSWITGYRPRGTPPEYWLIQGGSAQKGYLFQASGISKDKDFTSRGIWKGRKICHFCM